jgi:uncharacterized OB-fold protein
LVSFSRDALTENIMGMIDFEEGGRMFGSSDSFLRVKVDMPVVVQFRAFFREALFLEDFTVILWINQWKITDKVAVVGMGLYKIR